MTKLLTMRDAIARFMPDGSSVVLGCQMEQMIPFAAGHEIMRQKRRGLTLVGPISDILFDQMIGAGCASRVIAAWVGNVMMGSAYNFRRAVEQEGLKVTDMTNFTVALALQAAAMGVPFLPTQSAMGSDVARENEFFAEMESPFDEKSRSLGSDAQGQPAAPKGAARETAGVSSLGTTQSKGTPGRKLNAVKALHPDVAIVHVQRSDAEGNAHCWGNFGIMLEAVKAAKRVIVTAEEIVAPEVIASDPNRTVIPGFLVSAVVEAPMGAHPSPVQGYCKRDDAYFRQYHEQTKTKADFENWAQRWVHGVADRAGYLRLLGECRVKELGVKRHAYAAAADFGY
jgi:glutaconate CoA-transferase, subunit A